jgi:hypothetical protein
LPGSIRVGTRSAIHRGADGQAGQKKPAPKAKTSAALPKATDSGPCRIGVISAIGDEFVVQRIGLTVFGNEYT